MRAKTALTGLLLSLVLTPEKSGMFLRRFTID